MDWGDRRLFDAITAKTSKLTLYTISGAIAVRFADSIGTDVACHRCDAYGVGRQPVHCRGRLGHVQAAAPKLIAGFLS